MRSLKYFSAKVLFSVTVVWPVIETPKISRVFRLNSVRRGATVLQFSTVPVRDTRSFESP